MYAEHNLHRPDLGDACQSSNMATLLKSLLLVFNILFLPNYCVKYYDYIVKRCSDVACNYVAGYSLNVNFKLR